MPAAPDLLVAITTGEKVETDLKRRVGDLRIAAYRERRARKNAASATATPAQSSTATKDSQGSFHGSHVEDDYLRPVCVKKEGALPRTEIRYSSCKEAAQEVASYPSGAKHLLGVCLGQKLALRGFNARFADEPYFAETTTPVVKRCEKMGGRAVFGQVTHTLT